MKEEKEKEKTPKTYKSEEEVVKLICDSLEENLLKNMVNVNDFKELMENVTKEFLKRYPKEKPSLLISL